MWRESISCFPAQAVSLFLGRSYPFPLAGLENQDKFKVDIELFGWCYAIGGHSKAIQYYFDYFFVVFARWRRR